MDLSVAWLAVLVLGCGPLSSAFNLDSDSVVQRSGDPGSLFGFSMAMHRQLVPEDRRILLVGAPKAKALRGQVAKVTGGLYSCDMSLPDCRRVTFDDQEDPSKESKENQWMGVSVSSQGPGGKIVTCAHRYQRRSSVNTTIETRDIIGRCYVLSQDLTINPLSSEDGDSWHFCDSRTRGHERFGSCQQGLSATFDKDYHYIIFGAPGAYNWKGIVRLEQRNDTFLEMGIYDDGPFEVGDENQKDPTLVPAPANSYLGFSLDSGKRLTKQNQLTVVAGAPRANHSGAVVLLKTGGATSNILVAEHTLEGEGLASSFGYDLAVLDLNRDGWEDIVVGAPQYFEKEGEIGGAVYVYVNKAGRWNEVTPIRIDGPQDSMFGLAVENLGDINQDGFHDFAVGAPYTDNGKGSVYIYHGSDTDLRSKLKKPAQILSSSQAAVKLFGYSLAGNMDLDKNSYPDLAVGSLSDSVFIYRARPVIAIKREIKFSPNEINLSKKTCGDKFCLDVEACFTYTANPSSYSPTLTVAYTLEADADHRSKRLNSRAIFHGAADPGYESKGTVTLQRKGQRQCVTRRLEIQDNIKDKLRGIPIDVSVEIQNARRKRRQGVAPLSPIMDPNDLMMTRPQVNFKKEGCGDDNLCQSNLQVKYRYGYRTTDEETFTPLELKNGVPVISLSDQKDIALEVTVSNPGGDDAYEASVLATLPPSLTYSAFRPAQNGLQVTCTANKDGSQADCELGNPFLRNAETTFYLILGTSGISTNITELEVELKPDTTSEQKDLTPVKAKAKVAIELQLSISGQAHPSQVYFAGEVIGEDAIKSENEIGSAVTHQFRIINLGKRLTTGTVSLVINWPKDTKDGKWLLYLMKIDSTGVDPMDCSPQDVVNHLEKMPSPSRTRRAAENTQTASEGSVSRLSDTRKSTKLSCDNGAKCVEIRCPLRGLGSNAVITLNSRLWNGTFIEDFSDLHHVEVIVNASLEVDGTTRNTVLKNAGTGVRLTVFPERRAAQYGGVPWWIIVLSVLLGLLLLALLAFLLWKCGVFGDKSKEDPSEKEKLTNA